MQLMDDADAERATIERLRQRRREYEAAVTARLAALEEREGELRHTVESGEGLVDLLRAAHERGLLELALVELYLFDAVEEGPGAVPPAA
jgi:hypothetical protein